jgi:hypothetical protein
MQRNLTFAALLLITACNPRSENSVTAIDRHAVVVRHNVHLTAPDTLGSLSVGNGAFTFTADVSGLQTFYRDYENGIALGTQAEWAWHKMPTNEGFTLNDVAQEYETCNGRKVPYAIQRSDGRAREATQWLRANPHRLHLGLTGLQLLKKDGTPARLTDLKEIDQTLDLWSGTLVSKYTIDGDPVQVELVSLTDADGIAVRITSPLIPSDRLSVWLKFPYGAECHVCPGYDFEKPERHQTLISKSAENETVLERVLDSTRYFVNISHAGARVGETSAHTFTITPGGDTEVLEFTVQYSPREEMSITASFEELLDKGTTFWNNFWKSGGIIDFSKCTDPRAQELERRVILSQYLTRVQCSGTLPPQETGLTMNSWYGKFHLEMHWWHGVHFALWGRPELLEKSMAYYTRILDKARHTASWQGYRGARWPKMTDPYGNESPSSVGVFLAWQQPHTIYYAELLYREDPESALQKYQEIVLETAEFMASFAQFNATDSLYHLCQPLIPAQEIFPAAKTNDPPFELAYWRYALDLAQQWRTRAGLEPDPTWQDVIEKLAPLPRHNGYYLPAAGAVEAYTNDDNRRDHPVVTGAYGVLPLTEKIDTAIMANTFDEIMGRWNWETTWGWDYPMLAMCAARLGKPEKAIDALLMDVQKNTYLENGHNYQDQRLRLYLPGNGGLLTAVAMMAAGWDGASGDAPGFPKDGKWNVRWEGLRGMP